MNAQMQVVLLNNILAELKGKGVPPLAQDFTFLATSWDYVCACWCTTRSDPTISLTRHFKGDLLPRPRSLTFSHPHWIPTIARSDSSRAPSATRVTTVWQLAAPGDSGRLPRRMILTAWGTLAKRLLLRCWRSNGLGQAMAGQGKRKRKGFSFQRQSWKWPKRPHTAPKGFVLQTWEAQAHEDSLGCQGS